MVERVEIPSQSTGPEAPVENPQAVENTPSEASARPEWLPEKFESPEALAKAYSELEKQFTKQSQAEQAPENQESVNELVESAGLKLADLSEEYSQNGQLSEESYDKLAKIGIDRTYVDGYVRGQEALALQYQNDVVSVAGGQEKYADMIQWAAQNLSREEVLAFNAGVNSGDIQQAKLAVKGLFARFSESEGREPSLVRGSVGSSNGSVFRSVAELTEAMANPKYKSDPGYRQDVVDKLARSSIL